jgi:hypothetical protein
VTTADKRRAAWSLLHIVRGIDSGELLATPEARACLLQAVADLQADSGDCE